MGGMIPGNAGNDWLSQLAPDHAPPPPGWWPPAPGWWILAVLLITTILAAIGWWRHPPRRQKRLALRELQHLATGASDDASLARQLEHLLRRYAITRFGREAVAQLSGKAWLDFVVAHGGSAWAGDPGRDLLCLAYGGSAPAHREHWLRGARAFVDAPLKKHPS
jgi:hypothetical protein